MMYLIVQLHIKGETQENHSLDTYIIAHIKVYVSEHLKVFSIAPGRCNRIFIRQIKVPTLFGVGTVALSIQFSDRVKKRRGEVC
jgi:hypothetical protein